MSACRPSVVLCQYILSKSSCMQKEYNNVLVGLVNTYGGLQLGVSHLDSFGVSRH